MPTAAATFEPWEYDDQRANYGFWVKWMRERKMISISVSGVPVPKGRPRMTRGGIAYTPAHTRKYEDVVKLAAGQAMDGKIPLDCPLRVRVIAFLPVPQSWSGKRQREALAGIILPVSRPDCDNYGKLALDACNGIVFRDDSLVVELSIAKRYAEKPRLEIQVVPVNSWRDE